MFLFESSKEKEVRLGVERNMEICISNPKKYNEAKELLVGHIRGSDQKVIEMIVDNIKATIKNEDLQPIRKYQAILLLKDLMQSHNKAFGKYVVKKMLKRLTILAQHKSGSKEDRQEERGKEIFGPVKKDQEIFSIRFFNTLLMALQQWGKSWPKAPDGPYKDFHREYNELLMNGVQFPKERPKESTSKSPMMQSRPSKEQSKSPAHISPARPIDQPPKPAKQQKKQSKKLPVIPAQLQKQLQLFYNNLVESFNFLNDMLASCQISSLQTIKQIMASVNQEIEKGNSFVIKLDGYSDCESDLSKIESLFGYMEKIQKDIRILSKKPDQLEVFKNKYIKLTNKTIQILGEKAVAKKEKEKSTSVDKLDNSSPTISVIKTEEKTPNPPQAAKKQEPKIKNQNRYTSVSGAQVLEQFQKNNEFQSHSGQSVNSDRFGSFGGPGATERHRASFPIPTQNSDQKKQKEKGQSSSDRKNEDPSSKKKEEQVKPIPEVNEEKPAPKRPIENAAIKKQDIPTKDNLPRKEQRGKKEQKPIVVSPFVEVDKAEQKSIPNIFGEFAVDNSLHKKESSKNLNNPFKDNDSFGGFGFQTTAKNDSVDLDFFQKAEKKQNEVAHNLNTNNRRKKNNSPAHEEPQDFFNPNIKSQLDSQGLSAFSKLNKENSHSMSINKQPQPINFSSNAGTKKEVVVDNPFDMNTSQHGSQASEHNKSKFSDFERKSDAKDPFRKSVASNKSFNFEKENESEKKSVSENPFTTGNFGNLMKQKEKKLNPFENESIPSKKQMNNQIDNNPFKEDSFDKKSKQSKQSKAGFGSNPFQSKIPSVVENPFQTSTHKSLSAKNPFDEIQQFFKPPTQPVIESLSQRGSFKDVENNLKKSKNPFAGNFADNMGEPIRDSLVLVGNGDKQSEAGLNFSRFEDIPWKERSSHEQPFPFGGTQRKSNEQPFQFGVTDRKSNQNEKSGFSLSNFPGIGEPALTQTQKLEDPSDFFAKFDRVSHRSKSSKNEPEPKRDSIDIFEAFKMGSKSVSREQKEELSRKNIPFPQMPHQFQREKTVQSNDEKSFDFAQLDKYSAIIKKNDAAKEFEPYEFEGLNINKDTETKNNNPNMKVDLDNKSQKEFSWSDFDQPIEKKIDQVSVVSQQREKILEVESRHDLPLNPKDSKEASRVEERTDRENPKIIKFSNEPSLDLNLQDFAPLTKKGIQWNPLNKIQHLKIPDYYYNIDEKRLQTKKAELAQKQKQYDEKISIFKFAKQKSDQIRNLYLNKMKKIEDVVHQKEEYHQILKKLKETNDIKQKQISEVNLKIKRAEEIKAKILAKEKQLFEITKNQIKNEERKVAPQRSMASKRQMCNKNIENQRNSAYTIASRYSHSLSQGY